MTYQVNYDALRGRIDAEGIKYCKVAEYLGISVQALRKKLNGSSQFIHVEIYALKELLHLNDRDFLALFFSSQSFQKIDNYKKESIEK